MPGFDRTGPFGMGAMTGGRRGFCNSAYSTEVYGRGRGYGQGLGAGRGLGFGRGPGAGRGFRCRGYAPVYPASTTDEVSMLKAEADSVQALLNDINRRINELEKGAASPPAENQ